MYRFLLFTLLLMSALPAFAQERKVQNKPFIDERRFHYGFLIGMHDQSLKLKGNGYIDPATGAQWHVENDRHNYGFSVGVLGEWKLNNTFALRLVPSLHFGSKHLAFREAGSDKRESQDMKSCYVGLPFYLKTAGPRFNNYRPYVIAGFNPMMDLTSGKHSLLKAKPFTCMLELGLGCDLYLPFFKLIPELRFSLGLNNLLDKNRTDLTDASQMVFTNSVDSATLGMVALTFYFE